MSKARDIRELCAAHHNEDAHAQHVAALALQIFDRMHGPLGLDTSQRRVLEAASLLHDIGYHLDAAGHARAGARIVLSEGLRDYTPEERRIVAAVIALHQRSYQPPPDVSAFAPRRRGPERGLAAVLRVADGLDHGHVQDARIRSLRRYGGAVYLHVESRWYEGNAVAADRKADLWREVFPLDLRLKAQPMATGKDSFYGLLRNDDALLPAACKLLAGQYRRLTDACRRALEERPGEGIHRARTAIRRFRSGLRLFRAYFKDTSAPGLSRKLGALHRSLGPERDREVRSAFLVEHGLDRVGEYGLAWDEYLAWERAEEERLHVDVEGLLRGEAYEEAVRGTARFLRVEMSDRLREWGAVPLTRFAAKRLRKLMQRVVETAPPGAADRPETVDSFARLCRRARYWSEFLGPVLGGPVPLLAGDLTVVSHNLGFVRDVDLHRGVMAAHARAVPEAAERALRKRREQARRRFERTWEKLMRPGRSGAALRYLKQLKRELNS